MNTTTTGQTDLTHNTDLVKPLSEQRSEVLDTLALYFDALYEANAEKMAFIFHDRGVYATADEQPPLIRDKQVYLDVLRGREPPQARGEVRQDQIDGVEFAGPNTARARVQCRIGATDFVDYLTLIRDEGRWQIIAKIFQIKT